MYVLLNSESETIYLPIFQLQFLQLHFFKKNKFLRLVPLEPFLSQICQTFFLVLTKNTEEKLTETVTIQKIVELVPQI